MVAGRYRIIGLLGRGGMGEVYRADDLKLGQPVALKFLPESVEGSPDRLRRFLNEVRLALRITHSNVCRVHDIGEVDGQHYISMEYVDGEDLASLLRRIGRLPQDKAVEMARQLCAGLHAAHEQGILHRDLKPANVMLDGRGRIKITDFGLAGLQESFKGADIGAGTPAYMAPEQTSSQEVTARSDIYALGLVLYELFTGKQAFSGRTPAELARAHRDSAPTSPSSIVTDLDATVERVILRCLEKDPLKRPPSALAVSAALPGGDPLAAALAAGETPSPEMVAEAGQNEGLHPMVAGACLAAFAIGLVLYLFTASRTQITALTPLPNSPEVLVKEARGLLARIGYKEPPGDRTFGFSYSGANLRALNERHEASEHAQRLADGWPAVNFWYRESRSPLVPQDRTAIRARPFDPPRTAPGMVRVWLRADGGLQYLGVVPERYDATPGPYTEPDWTPLFEASGIDLASLVETESVWTPNVNTDSRRAWKARMPAPLDVEVHIEAASFRGRPVLYQVYWPWNEPPSTSGPSPRTLLSRAGDLVGFLWFPVVLAGGGLMARHNVRLGRGDRKRAVRLGLIVCGCRFLAWVFGAHHVASNAELDLLLSTLAEALFIGTIVTVLYLALEPYFRRIWPRWLVTWVRLLDGRLRDPLVGRDALVGAIYGIGLALLFDLYHLVPRWLSLPTPLLVGMNRPGEEVVALGGLRHSMAQMGGLPGDIISFVLVGVMMLLVLRVILRKNWLAYGAWVVLGVVMFNPRTSSAALDLTTVLIVMLAAVVMLIRFGLLTFMVGGLIHNAVESVTITLEPSSWYASGMLLAFAMVSAVAGYAFWISLGGKPLFADEAIES
jgi:serine/threonine-protein kinase